MMKYAFGKMKLRQTLSALIAVCLFMGLLQSVAYADVPVLIDIGTVTGTPGDTVDVAVVMDPGTQNVLRYELNLSYDPNVLEPVFANPATSTVQSVEFTPTVDPENGKMHVVAAYFGEDLSWLQGTQKIFVMHFQIKDTANAAVSNISLSTGSRFTADDSEWISVDLDTPGSVTVTPKPATVSVAIGTASGAPGEAVDVPVSIQQSTAPAAAYGMQIDFDPNALEVLSVTGLSGDIFNYNQDNEAGWLKVAWTDESGGDNGVGAQSDLFTVRFRIHDNASLGDKPLTISQQDILQHLTFVDSNAIEMSKTVIAGKVTVNPASDAGNWVDITGPQKPVFGPVDVAVDNKGIVYVADSSTIKKRTANGVWEDITPLDITYISGLAAGPNGAIYVSSSRSSTIMKYLEGNWEGIAASGLSTPVDVAVDGQGNVYVADSEFNKVKRLEADQWVNVTNTSVHPVGLAAGNDGTLYVTDTSNKVRKLSGDTWEDITAGAAFHSPKGIAVDADGSVYVADSNNYAVKKLSGGVWTTVSAEDDFIVPQGAAVDQSGNVYVSDNETGQVKKLIVSAETPVIGTQPTGATVNQGDASPVLGVAATVSDGGTLTYQWHSNTENRIDGGVVIPGATGSTYSAPAANAGTVYYYVVVTNTNSAAGEHTTATAVSGIAAVTVNAATAGTPSWTDITGNGQFSAPMGAAIAPDGTLYVTDSTNRAIKKLTNDGWVETTGAVFNSFGLTFDQHGTLYATNTPGNAVMMNLEGTWTNITNGEGFFQPRGIAVDENGNVYVADWLNHAVKKFSDGQWTTINGNEYFTYPQGVAVDSHGIVYVTDGSTKKIKKLENDMWTAIPDGGQLNNPTGIAVDRKGNLYVVDYSGNKVKMLSNGVWTDIGGEDDFTQPYGVAVDSEGAVYVTDAARKIVKKWAVNAAVPSIIAGPTGTTVQIGSEHPSLTVTATVSDNGTLSYQWYKNTTSSTEGGTLIDGATLSSYSVPTEEAGTAYYYVVVKNTNSAANGDKTAEVKSAAVAVTVNATVPAVYTVTFNSQGGTPASAVLGASHGTKLARPNAPVKNGYTFDGWYKDTAGATAWNFDTDVVTSDVTLYAKWTAVVSDGDSGSSNGGGNSAPANDGVVVLVNGKEEKIGKMASSTEGEQSVTTVTVDQQQLENKLKAEGQGAVVTIPVSAKSDIIVGELNGRMIKNMEDKQAVLVVKTGNASYTLPALQLDIDAISKQLGSTVALEDIKVQIRIAAPEAGMVKTAEDAAKQNALELVAPPVDFTVKAAHEGAAVDVTKFQVYVERTIALPDGVDASKITTGIVTEADGSVRHVPTKVTLEGGKYYAHINSLTNSLYAVVWHPLVFADMEGHWAKEAVNDMGSRLVVNGVGSGKYNPDQDMTRAEFAAILMRGLGLKPVNGKSQFADVKESDWYNSAVQTAYEYKLVEGFEDGSFRPQEKITREQAMVMIAKAMAITGLKEKLAAKDTSELLKPYADAAQVAEWAKAGAAASLQADLVSGRGAAELAPKANITRAEVAAIVQRLLKASDLI